MLGVVGRAACRRQLLRCVHHQKLGLIRQMSRAVAVADACKLPVHVRTERVAVTIARAVDDITEQVDYLFVSACSTSRSLQCTSFLTRLASSLFATCVQYCYLKGDPVRTAKEAIEIEPDCALVHCTIGMFHCIGQAVPLSHEAIVGSLAEANRIVEAGLGGERDKAYAQVITHLQHLKPPFYACN
jgi:hypothetical protein